MDSIFENVLSKRAVALSIFIKRSQGTYDPILCILCKTHLFIFINTDAKY